MGNSKDDVNVEKDREYALCMLFVCDWQKHVGAKSNDLQNALISLQIGARKRLSKTPES